MMIIPIHTFGEVVKTLVEGLEDGGITLRDGSDTDVADEEDQPMDTELSPSD